MKMTENNMNGDNYIDTGDKLMRREEFKDAAMNYQQAINWYKEHNILDENYEYAVEQYNDAIELMTNPSSPIRKRNRDEFITISNLGKLRGWLYIQIATRCKADHDYNEAAKYYLIAANWYKERYSMDNYTELLGEYNKVIETMIKEGIPTEYELLSLNEQHDDYIIKMTSYLNAKTGGDYLKMVMEYEYKGDYNNAAKYQFLAAEWYKGCGDDDSEYISGIDEYNDLIKYMEIMNIPTNYKLIELDE